MNFFTKKITVDTHDEDFNGIASASALMRYIQSAAQTQLAEIGSSYDELKERGYAFILSKIKMEIFKPARAYEPLLAMTFPANSRGYSFLRCYQLESDGELIARAAAIWALVDIKSRALVRVNDFELGLETFEPIDMIIDRVNMPERFMPAGNYRVSYADTDRNRHMNNTRYPDIYANFLPMEKKRVSSISINYENEAPLGENLSVFIAEEDGFYYIKTLREDSKVNSVAKISLTDIL